MDSVELAQVNEAAGDPTSSWEPAVSHNITPTLIIACGGISEDDLRTLQYNLSLRLGLALYPSEQPKLGFLIPADVVLCKRIGSADQITKGTLAGFIAPFFQQAYLESLVARKILRGVPTREDPLCVQIIVLYEDAKDQSSENLLESLENEIPNAFEGYGIFSLVLVSLGEPSVGLASESHYWPRFCLQTTTSGGMIATRERIWEVCQNLIISLISSEVGRAINFCLEQDRHSVKWIWIGAASLVSDVSGMYEYVRLTVLQQLIQALLADELPSGGRRWLDKWSQEQALLLRNANRRITLQLAENLGWDIKPKLLKQRFAGLRQRLNGLAKYFGWDAKFLREKEARLSVPLTPGVALREKIAMPDMDLAKILRDYYIQLRDQLERNLFEVVKAGYSRLLEEVATVMPARMMENDQAPVTELEDHRPGGLAAVLYAVEAIASAVKKSPELNLKGVSMHLAKSEYFLSRVADADANAILSEYRRYIRYARPILSPLGFLLKIIPAWPTLAALFFHYLLPDEQRSIIYSGLFLLVIGLVTYFYLKDKTMSFRKMLQKEQEQFAAFSGLGIAMRILHHYRMMVIAHLRSIAYTLRNLRVLLEQVRKDYQARVVHLESRFAEYDEVESIRSQSAVYRLADLTSCREWAEVATRRADQLLREVIVKEVFEKSRQSFNHVFNQMVIKSDEAVTKEFDEGAIKGLQVHALIGKKKLLKERGHWKWLYEHAQPMGGGRVAKFKWLTIATVAIDAVFKTAHGEKPEGWLVARSLMSHEIGCINALVEYRGSGENQHGMD